ncbi:MAG TPA: DUF3619 family protein [Nitrospiraceae bacterium]|nr:DUF3619 family protein [Nitrospiraceae bacterium]
MNDMRFSDDDVFLAQAKRALDDTVQRVDARLAGRLQRARRQALANLMSRRPWKRWAGAVAMTSVGLLMVLFLANRPDIDNHGQPILEDVELMASPENVELSEDLEFYDWLADSTTNG